MDRHLGSGIDTDTKNTRQTNGGCFYLYMQVGCDRGRTAKIAPPSNALSVCAILAVRPLSVKKNNERITSSNAMSATSDLEMPEMNDFLEAMERLFDEIISQNRRKIKKK